MCLRGGERSLNTDVLFGIMKQVRVRVCGDGGVCVFGWGVEVCVHERSLNTGVLLGILKMGVPR